MIKMLLVCMEGPEGNGIFPQILPWFCMVQFSLTISMPLFHNLTLVTSFVVSEVLHY